MVVAIDGPAGAGKSTVARAVAATLGFTYLDSGAMYRAVGLLTLEEGGAASEVAERLDVSIGERVVANGRDVTEAIREPRVSEAASKVATNQAVRAAELGIEVDAVLRDQALRDAQDSSREHSPLKPAEGSVELDTTGLAVDEVVARIADLVATTRS